MIKSSNKDGQKRGDRMNKALLKSYMALHGDVAYKLAKEWGMSKSNISDKMNGKRDFSLKEMRLFKDRYNLSSDEFVAIFFDAEPS